MAAALRLIFMGTAEFGVPSLHALAASRHDLVAVYTQPPRPAGRGYRPRPTSVHEAAQQLGLEVRTPSTLRSAEVQAGLVALAADLGVVAAYGLILPEPVLQAPRLGCINLHPSLLPRWRGAAPIQRALLEGDTETGVTIFQVEAGLDTGPVVAMEREPIAPDDTASSLHDRLAALAARMVVKVVEDSAAGRVEPRPQPATGVTYAAKIGRDEGRINWHWPAPVIERRLRALNPHPGCWTEARSERLLLLAGDVVPGAGEPGTVLDDRLTVACGEGALRITRIKRAGRRAMAAGEFLKGFPLPAGSRLG